MVKLLFFDYRELETVRGFTRELQQPAKLEANPLIAPDRSWEQGNMQLYGSVIKAPGRPFQMWYTVIHKPWNHYVCYAESDDGLEWRKPMLGIFEYEGEKTNVVFANQPHGTAVIYDADDPREDRHYKMVTGSDPSQCICAYHSADGVHWQPVRRFPVLGTNPDCPMGFVRAPDGRHVIYHRLHGYGRRVFRSESWDFRYFGGEPRMVLEPGPFDDPQIEFYGMGSTVYGPYEIGTLWIYHTVAKERGGSKRHGHQETELTYARSGHAWHRAAPTEHFIPHGGPNDWDSGNLQCASQPVFLGDEIRYYFMGTDMRHQRKWELEPQKCGVGFASMKPDRFVAVRAGDAQGELTTVAFGLPSERIFVNARAAPGGWVKAEVLDVEAEPLEGLGLDDCSPMTGDSTAHHFRWHGSVVPPTDRPVRLRLVARNASVFSVFAPKPNEEPVYHRFRAVRP